MNENEVMNQVTEEATEMVTKPSGLTNGQAAVIGGIAALLIAKAATFAYHAYQAHKEKKKAEATRQPNVVEGEATEVDDSNNEK